MNIDTFRRIGFLLESNRLFFHPHGLALEVTTVDARGWTADNPRVQVVASVLREGGLTHEKATELAREVLNAQYPTGSEHISGVWDYRDDREGIIFGDNVEEKQRKAATVRAERDRHRSYRSALFGRADTIGAAGLSESDIEPLDWVISEEQLEELRNGS